MRHFLLGSIGFAVFTLLVCLTPSTFADPGPTTGVILQSKADIKHDFECYFLFGETVNTQTRIQVQPRTSFLGRSHLVFNSLGSVTEKTITHYEQSSDSQAYRYATSQNGSGVAVQLVVSPLSVRVGAGTDLNDQTLYFKGELLTEAGTTYPLACTHLVF